MMGHGLVGHVSVSGPWPLAMLSAVVYSLLVVRVRVYVVGCEYGDREPDSRST